VGSSFGVFVISLSAHSTTTLDACITRQTFYKDLMVVKQERTQEITDMSISMSMCVFCFVLFCSGDLNGGAHKHIIVGGPITNHSNN
jgi:hypothetical protein